MKLKVCGMKYNTAEVALLQPDYLGFIFYDKSPRYFEGTIPEVPASVKKVGVFVDATIEDIITQVQQHKLSVIQLHGEETAPFIEALKKRLVAKNRQAVALWKVFSIKDKFNFQRLTPFEPLVDAFLFDTKGKNKGGNGYAFDWTILSEYPSNKPFVLSGGIGLDEVDAVLNIRHTKLPIMAIDLNSKFEIAPGLKDPKLLKQLMTKLNTN